MVPAASDSPGLRRYVMNRRKWLAAIVAVTGVVGGGLAFASATRVKGYTCPITGEELPCEKCCPLNGETGQTAVTAAKTESPKATGEVDYTCPLTGEKLGCPNCCPLNKAKK
jgi:hypothetical protein